MNGQAAGGTALSIRQLVKRFGNTPAVDGIDLEVEFGEFLTLLGPSGSGKTTTLRMIAGFMRQTSGTIEIGGIDMSQVPPYRRDLGMVFQNYALFPHMTAAENVAFPLEMRRMPRAEIRRQVAEALALVRLQEFAGRYPRQLSGGQQQRIALARAVVFKPRLLLMDEPLGALDKKLREALQLEIVRVSRELGATVIYVTHDQEEALVMSDRIAIFRQGRIEQLGSGEDLYDRPASMFVADFIGESSLLHGRLERDADGAWLAGPAGRWRVGAATLERAGLTAGSAAALVVRPERMRIAAPEASPPDGANAAAATVGAALYLGSDRKYELALDDGGRAVVRRPLGSGEPEWRRDERVTLWWPVDAGVLVADEAGPGTGPGPTDPGSGSS